MKIHSFTHPTVYSDVRAPIAPVTVHGITFAQWREIHRGDFCELPRGWMPCHEGFRPYRTEDGNVIAVQVG